MWSEAILVATLSFSALASLPCVRRDADSSFICVCNSTYCDDQDPFGFLPFGQIAHYITDKDELRFQENIEVFYPGTPPADANVSQVITVRRNQQFQTILGWGGAFTDSTGINLATLSEAAQDKLLRQYYHDTGLDYNIGRINMGGCDFSPRAYTYLDTPNDLTLATFALQEEDIVYKIPYVKQAQSIRGSEIKLFASPWTAPPWMKSNNDYIGRGHLLPEYYQLWADYFIRFLQDYSSNGITFWGLTAQNEPEDGNVPGFSFNCMGWNATTQKIFIAENLGPSLEQSGFGQVKLMVLDDNRYMAKSWSEEVFSDPRVNLYVDGIAVHWYTDDVFPSPDPLDETHAMFPDKFLFYTEACNAYKPTEGSPILGRWNRAERYLHNIIEDLNHWVVGWTDWNLALDLEGGPNWAGNFVDAPIIINATADEFYKQPMYYALGHVTRFIPPDSVRVQLDKVGEAELEMTAFERPDRGIAIVIMNRDDEQSQAITIVDPNLGYLDLSIEPSSMHTIVYWP